MAKLKAGTTIGGVDILDVLNKKVDQSALDNIENEIGKSRPISFDQVKFIAHRGYSWLGPENSKAAFYFAGTRRGAFWGVETDIRYTADGHWICMHDPTVDRTTNGTGNIAEMTLNQIKALTIDFIAPSQIPINEVVVDKKVPTLEEYLQIMNELNLIPVIEIKSSGDFQTLFYLIKRYGFEEKCVVISFYGDYLKQLRAFSKKIKMMLLSSYVTPTEIAICQEIGNCGINFSYERLNAENVNIARTYDLEVGVWTVNDIPTIEHARRLGVDYITTDYGAGRFLNKQKRISLTTINGKLGVSQAYSSEDATLEWHSGYQAVKVTYEYPFRSMIGGTGGTAYLSRHIVTDNLGYKFSTRGETYDHLFLQVKKDGNIINPLEGLSDTIWVNILVDSY